MLKLAVITETSTAAKNKDILGALDGLGHTVFNVGMKGTGGEGELTTVETGLMSALALHLGCVDFVIGGCGTGQGYMNSVLQYPGIVCGLINSPLDAWLFSQINAGNCVSLALNKGYGWAGEIKLRHIFQRLFENEAGLGYPEARKEAQGAIREEQKRVSQTTHHPFPDVLRLLDIELIKRVLQFDGFYHFLVEYGDSYGYLYECIVELGREIGIE